jgi:hypothetical protein
MTASENAARRLTLAVRRYLGRLLFIIVVVTALAMLTTPGVLTDEQAVYESSALVVARELAIRPEGLPRFASVIFEGGSVAEAAAATMPAPYEASDLIPDRARVVSYENTVVLEVIGEDTDPELAASIANSVANAFVDELNRAGEGVGVFAIQDTARVPRSPTETAGPIVPTVVGLLAGSLLAMGVLGLILTIRRPLLTGYDVSEAAEAPVLAKLHLQRGGPTARLPSGAATLGRTLFPDGAAGFCAVLSTEGATTARRTVVTVLCRVQESLGDVYLVSQAKPSVWTDLEGTSVKILDALPPRAVAERAPVIVDDPTEEGLLLLMAAPAIFTVVAKEGEPERPFASVLRRVPPSQLVGTIFAREDVAGPREIRRRR